MNKITINYIELTYYIKGDREFRNHYKNFASLEDAKEWLLAHYKELDAPQWSGHYSIGDDEYKWLNKAEVAKYKGAIDSFKNDPFGEGLFRIYTDKGGEKWATEIGWLRNSHIDIIGNELNTSNANE